MCYKYNFIKEVWSIKMIFLNIFYKKMAPFLLFIGATYFGYFKMMEAMAVKDTRLFNYVFQKADLVEDFDYH